jgi:hypothetical protein
MFVLYDSFDPACACGAMADLECHYDPSRCMHTCIARSGGARLELWLVFDRIGGVFFFVLFGNSHA